MTPRLVFVFCILLFIGACGTSSQNSSQNPSVVLRPQNFSNFITRNSDKLFDGSSEFKTLAVSIPTLHRNEDNLRSNDSDRWSDEFEIKDAIHSIVRMGGNATRIYTLSMKRASGASEWHVNGLRNYNENGFRALDKVLQIAAQNGVRVIIPFIDTHDFPAWGGVGQFAGFSGHAKADFYSNSTVKQNFKNLILDVLNRTNYYTGVQYKNDKTVLAWQLGNELEQSGATDTWSSEMASYIKSIDSNHLVMDGRDNQFNGVINDANIDIMDGHYYGVWDNTTDLAALARTARNATKNKKVLLISEFGLASTSSIQALMDEMINTGISGGFLWGLRGHHRDGGFRFHDEGNGYFSYHYPGFASGNSYDETNVLNLLRQKAYAIRGQSVPAITVPNTPTMLAASYTSALSWQGSAGASSYILERATSNSGPWTVVANDALDDKSAPLYSDSSVTAGTSYYYRVTAKNSAGSSGVSNTIGPVTARLVLTDDLNDWSKSYSHGNLTFDTANASKFGGDTSRAARNGVTSNEEIVWKAMNSKTFEATTYFWNSEAISDFSVFTSSDGSSYTQITPSITNNGGDWSQRIYKLDNLSNTNYIKMRWNNTGGQSWSPQIAKVSISYEGSAAQSVLTDDLNDWSKSYSHGNLTFDTTNSSNFGGDTSRAARNGVTSNEEIVWKATDSKSFEAITYFWNSEAVSDFSTFTSSDGSNWTQVTPTITNNGGNWSQRVYKLNNLSNTNYVKMRWNNTSGQSWSPQIAKITIQYSGTATQSVLTDDLNDWSKSYSHGNLIFDTANSGNFGGDTSRAYRNGVTSNEEIVWKAMNSTSFEATTYFWNSEAVSDFSVYTSSDGSSYTQVTPTITNNGGNWSQRVYKLNNLSNTNYIKMRWNNTSGQSWSPQISKVIINYSGN
jgi:hypothetical protein